MRTLALLLLLAACGGMKDPGSVADKFVDKYYVESDQDSALAFTTGVATMRLKDELGLTAEARRGNTGMTMRQVRVYYSRKSLTGDGPERKAEYELDIRPQGGGDLQREAHLRLAREPDGTWRVADFSESQK
ncbi:MAG: hypothetical protein ABR567_18140 [Myxococcales bacterium]|nr:hypothetical protein [Myxococcales bacterium]